MKKTYLLFFLLIGITIHAQKVSNVSFRQEQSNIVVSYDLETQFPCEVSLYVSLDGGKIWKGPLKKVAGDSGSKITSGSKSMVWNVLEEFEELRGNTIVFQVRAKSGKIETVKIGKQEWMLKNLDLATYSDGTPIPEVRDQAEWKDLTTGAWCYYDNDPSNGETYGKLYNWYAVAGIWNEASKTDASKRKKLAPAGYHIPSTDEWNTLANTLFLDENLGDKMKATAGWEFQGNGTNESGFTALPGGCRRWDGFSNLGCGGNWWTSSGLDTKKAWGRILSCGSEGLGYSRGGNSKSEGLSVRCLKD